MKRINLLLTLLVLTAVTSLRADPYFVVPHDTPDHTPGDFKSWASAATNIQDAISAAGAVGATVWVSNGHYRLTAQITIGDLKLRSWPDGLTNRDTTIIDGNYPNTTNRCFVMNNAAALVEGFTITNGYRIGTGSWANGGGGVSMTAGILRNCLVSGNTVEMGNGGGVWARYSNTIIDNCDIIGNLSTGVSGSDSGRGGGVALYNSAQVWNSRIERNETDSNWMYAGGGGVFGGRIYNCIIVSNTVAAAGAGVSYPELVRNSLIAGNISSWTGSTSGGGGYFSESRSPSQIVNCTIVHNKGRPRGGVWSMRDDRFIINSIVIYNYNENDVESNLGRHVSYDGDIICDHVLTRNEAGVIFVGDGNITDREPRFMNPDAGNYRLSGGSPCIDAGTNQLWMVDATDLAGNARIGNQVVDIGAYEYIPRGIMIMFK